MRSSSLAFLVLLFFSPISLSHAQVTTSCDGGTEAASAEICDRLYTRWLGEARAELITCVGFGMVGIGAGLETLDLAFGNPVCVQTHEDASARSGERFWQCIAAISCTQ